MHEQQDLLFTLTGLPLGSGDDISLPVSETVAALEKNHLNYQINGSCTLIEGKWDRMMPVIEKDATPSRLVLGRCFGQGEKRCTPAGLLDDI